MTKKVLIVGYGVVGSNLAEEIGNLEPDIYDKYKEIDTREHEKYDYAFICVDTPYSEDNPCDITEVRNAINENDAELYIIKSTVLPGTTDMLRNTLNKNIVFSPEYYGGTQHANNPDYSFTIIGGNIQDAVELQNLLQNVYDGYHVFRIVEAETAELTKYMENAWIAYKVSFMHQFYDIATDIGVDYEELRELFLLDPRVSRSHTFVYRDHDFWSSHCLDKDVPAIAEEYDAELLKAVINYNNKRKTL